jgi:hypothetical protein
MEEENDLNKKDNDSNHYVDSMNKIFELIIPFEQVDYTSYSRRYFLYILFSIYLFFIGIFFIAKSIITLRFRGIKEIFKSIKNMDSAFKEHFNI